VVRRLLRWLRGVAPPPPTPITDADGGFVERPWLRHWEFLPKRSAGHDFTREDYETARDRSVEGARTTHGPELWEDLERHGYLELPSRRFPGVTYRMRVGRRIEVRCEPGVRAPWPMPFLCINPEYPLPELEFFAQLYMYVRDREDIIVRVAAPQPWDQLLGRTF
jgi:hypothetical protein